MPLVDVTFDYVATSAGDGALEGLRDTGRLGPVYDFSATPIFIEGTDRKERMFPWVVSDFPLIDSIESGLVKIPQVPVDDDSASEQVQWRNLYANTTPKKVKRDAVPAELNRALTALYRSYEQKFNQWMHPNDPAKTMPTPPVFIVVANNIANATAIADHIAGCEQLRAPCGCLHRYLGVAFIPERLTNIRVVGVRVILRGVGVRVPDGFEFGPLRFPMLIGRGGHGARSGRCSSITPTRGGPSPGSGFSTRSAGGLR